MKDMLDRYITVKNEFKALHRWKNAPSVVAFLRDFHRHVFKVSTTIGVFENDRELEFFIMQNAIQKFVDKEFRDKKMDKGCEQMSEDILLHVQKKVGKDRFIKVEVSEDGENSGFVMFSP